MKRQLRVKKDVVTWKDKQGKVHTMTFNTRLAAEIHAKNQLQHSMWVKLNGHRMK